MNGNVHTSEKIVWIIYLIKFCMRKNMFFVSISLACIKSHLVLAGPISLHQLGGAPTKPSLAYLGQ